MVIEWPSVCGLGSLECINGDAQTCKDVNEPCTASPTEYFSTGIVIHLYMYTFRLYV